jgi:hypothetical protein
MLLKLKGRNKEKRYQVHGPPMWTFSLSLALRNYRTDKEIFTIGSSHNPIIEHGLDKITG